MKPLQMPSCSTFTLSQMDCAKIGIKYEPNLLLYPSSFDWKPIQKAEEREFDDSDLSTYPVDAITKRINYIIIRLIGFKDVKDGYIYTPSKNTITKKEFIDTLLIRYKNDFKPFGTETQMNLQGRFIFGGRHGFLTDEHNSIFIELDVTNLDLSTNKRVGLKPEMLANKNINDIITVSWTESNIRVNNEMNKEDNIVVNVFDGRKYLVTNVGLRPLF